MLGIEYEIFAELCKEMSKGLKDFTHKGHCVKCGECCSNTLPLCPSDITVIRAYITEHEIKAVSHTKNEKVVDNSCPFLSLNKRCTIYEVRLLICKLYKCNRKAPQYKHKKLLEKEKMQLKDVRAVFFGK